MSTMALIDIGHSWIALPHREIATIENISSAESDHSSQSNYWMLQQGRRHWALYHLDEQLQPQPLLPPQHPLVLCLRQHAIAFSCLQVSSLDNPVIQKVPAMMRKPASALCGLILHQQRLILQVDVLALCQRVLALTDDISIPAIEGAPLSCNVQPGI